MDDRTRQAKIELIEQLDAARKDMLATLAGVEPHAEIYPDWTVKELLAHFTGWDEAVTSSLRAHAGGNELPAVADQGIDYYNAESVATREALDHEHIAREWAQARDELKAALRAMPPDCFDVPVIFPWGASGTVTELVCDFCLHEQHHAREIRERLKGL